MDAEKKEALRKAFRNPTVFCETVLEFKPTKYQRDLAEKFIWNQFVAARWCRQSGKSHIISALLLWYALTHPGCNIAVVGPSWRQSKLIIRKINSFLRKLPKRWYHKPLQTMVRLKNGSTIEAFPNNPETIRGPTLHIVYCDEMNFIADDEELYDAILFTLGTTNGRFICSSTPWSTDSVFYRIFNSPDYEDYARSHVTWKEAVEPNGPLKKRILKSIRRQLKADPWRWRREMEAEWAEDENVWLPQDLITRCIGTVRTLGFDLEYFRFEDYVQGEFYIGGDFGKHRDHTVLAAVERKGNRLLLRYCHQFPLRTPYASVIGHMKVLSDRWHSVNATFLDKTGIGEYIVEDAKNAGVSNVEGITFTEERKEELATALKEQMTNGNLWIPYDENLINELNTERFKLTKTGRIRFSHPPGTHDDRFWALALATYAAIRKKKKPSLLLKAY